MPLPLTVSCFSKIQIGIGFTFLVPAHLGSPRKGPLNGCVCVCCIKVRRSEAEASFVCIISVCDVVTAQTACVCTVMLLQLFAIEKTYY